MLWFDRAGLDDDLYTTLSGQFGPRRPRVLAWATTKKGVIVALPERMAIHDGEHWSSLRWIDITHGAWDPQTGELSWRVRAEGESGTLKLEEPRDLPEIFRDRIQASILVVKRIELPHGGAVKISGRREPSGKRGNILWEVDPSPDADVENPENQRLITDTFAWLKSEYDI